MEDLGLLRTQRFQEPTLVVALVSSQLTSSHGSKVVIIVGSRLKMIKVGLPIITSSVKVLQFVQTFLGTGHYNTLGQFFFFIIQGKWTKSEWKKMVVACNLPPPPSLVWCPTLIRLREMFVLKGWGART